MANTWIKQRLKGLAPIWLWNRIKYTKRSFLKGFRRCFDAAGFTIAKKSDYYSPLPSEFELARNLPRWNKPSRLYGIEFDIDAQKRRFGDLQTTYLQEYLELPSYDANVRFGFGPGFPEVDALTLYMIVRHFKPKRYLEIGSGLSTFYCSRAAAKNRNNGNPVEITCVEPFPFQTLSRIPDIRIIKNQVQNLDLGTFAALEGHDILFIDSSHVVRIDGDVPFLFLEVIPTLKAGVIIHIHDIPFPYNVPFPANQWVLGRNMYSPYWPMYWNEAMLLQALLSNNSKLDLLLSTPLIRYHDESFLRDRIPFYRTITEEPNTFSSIWLQVAK